MTYDKFSTIFLKERIKQNAGTIKNFADKIGMKPSKLYSRLSYKTYFCLGDIVEIGNCLTMSCPEESEACFFFPIDKEKNCYFNIFKAFTDRNISFELVSKVLEISIGTLYLKLMGQTPFTLSEVLEIHETFVNDIPLEKLARTGVEQ